MAATITLRFPATCRDCGAALAAGTTARYYGRGKVYGTTCHQSGAGDGAPRSRSYSRSYTPRPRGRCEDAPCCGCCDTGSTGSEPFFGYGR